MSLANARFTCSEMDKSKTVAVGIRRSRFLVLILKLVYNILFFLLYFLLCFCYNKRKKEI